MLFKLVSEILKRKKRARGETPPLTRARVPFAKEENAVDAMAEALRKEFGLAAGDDLATAMAITDLLWREPSLRWWHRLEAIERIGRHFSRAGGYGRWGTAFLQYVARYDPARLAAGDDENTVIATLYLLQFDKRSAAWAEQIFEVLVLPWMRSALAADRFRVGLMLETHAYVHYVLREENEERFRRSFQLWTDDMRSAGARAAKALARLPSPEGKGAPGIAFYLQSGGVLAHTQLLLDFLEAHAAFERPMIRAFVFLRGRAEPELASRLNAIGVPFCELETLAGTGHAAYFDSLLAMRRRIAEERITAAVWVSAAVHMAFAFSMRIAPVQIWWALKYHSLHFPEIDGYLTSGSAGSTKKIGGRVWRSTPLAARDWHRPELAGAASVERSRFAQHRVLFGTFGREAKLNSPIFLGTVAEILRALPDAGFLWTGRERNPEIQSRLESLGVAQRCHYIGWVNTKLYAQVIDVFLDSFPFPCAYTLYESMAAARPSVHFASAEAEESGLHRMLAPLLAGEEGTPEEQLRARAIFSTGPGSLYLCATDTTQYVTHAVRLATDAQVRRAAGETNRRFIAEFLSDPAQVARNLATHLVEITLEARKRPPT